MNRRVIFCAIAAIALAACGRHEERDHGRVVELQREVDDLRLQNAGLERRVAQLEAAPSVAPMPMTAASPTAPIRARCRKDGDRYTLTAAETEEVTSNLASISAEERIVPDFENGNVRGMKIFAVRPDSFLASCGLLNGDVVSSVNGIPISSPDAALNAYSEVRKSDHATFAITRKGEPLTITIATR